MLQGKQVTYAAHECTSKTKCRNLAITRNNGEGKMTTWSTY